MGSQVVLFCWGFPWVWLESGGWLGCWFGFCLCFVGDWLGFGLGLGWGLVVVWLVVLAGEGWSWYAEHGTTIYGTPMTLSALAFNIVMAISGGIIGAWIFTKDPFWMMSGALAGIISVASGLDIYFPAHVFIIATIAGIIIKPCADWLEGFGIDDAVGAVTIHGTIGLFGVVVLGIFASEIRALHQPFYRS